MTIHITYRTPVEQPIERVEWEGKKLTYSSGPTHVSVVRLLASNFVSVCVGTTVCPVPLLEAEEFFVAALDLVRSKIAEDA